MSISFKCKFISKLAVIFHLSLLFIDIIMLKQPSASQKPEIHKGCNLGFSLKLIKLYLFVNKGNLRIVLIFSLIFILLWFNKPFI